MIAYTISEVSEACLISGNSDYLLFNVGDMTRKVGLVLVQRTSSLQPRSVVNNKDGSGSGD